MQGYLNWIRAAALVLAATAGATAQERRSPAGEWSATVRVNDVEIPFRFEIARNGSALVGSFFDGDRRVSSSKGRFENGVLTLQFDQYAATLEATLSEDGQLEGRYLRGSRPTYAFHAARAVPVSTPAGEVPSIAGLWTIAVQSTKGESAWRFIVRQNGPEISAAILRVDGDTGMLTGRFHDGSFVLSHFSGARPTLLEVKPAADGTLQLLQNRKTPLVAVRADGPQSTSGPAPTDPSQHTRVQDPSVPFAFAFPDLSGRVVTNTDPRFQGKVVLVSITGSWCPNCHDEAPFLSSLYKKYRKKGFEIVALSFEEADELANPQRLRSFIARYGIEYTVLLAGEPEQLNEKVPQGVNLNAFPTTFILGRDGRVRAVHAGFPSAASGSFHTKAQAELTELAERLLTERAPGTY